jgi:16S rRNA (guanine527-N7)-methyltransferase
MQIILKYFSDFSELQLKQFAALEELYKEWNSKINVISRKDIDGLYEKHVLHSLSIAVAFDFEKGTEIIDIGTGGGFPGIPLAIFFPEVKFHLVDSIAKKLKVVTAIAAEIGLENITTQHIRTEEIKNRKFDFAVSRAVAPLKDLWRWSKPMLRHRTQDTRYRGAEVRSHDLQHADGFVSTEQGSGRMTPGLICLKGGDLAQEISETNTRPGMIEIFDVFAEEYFKEKYILYIPK